MPVIPWVNLVISNFPDKARNPEPTLSEKIAQSTVYLHLRQFCVFLHFTAVHKVS